jgi:hypothetical protein
MTYVSGQPNSLIFVEYQKHFIQYVKPLDNNKILMFPDSRQSHCSAEATLAKESGIVLLTVPPHISHELQPLNRLVLGYARPTIMLDEYTPWHSYA